MLNTAFYSQESTVISHLRTQQNTLKKIPNGSRSDYKLQEYEKLLVDSKKIKFTQGQVDALLNLALTNYYAKRNFDQIILQTEEIEKLAAETEDFFSQSIAKVVRAGVLMDFGLIEQGKKELDEAQNLSEKITDNSSKHIAKSYYFKFYSDYFYAKNDYKKVVSSSKKREGELKLLSDFSPEKKYLLIETYRVLCSAYLNLGKYENAEKYLKIQESYFKNNEDWYNLAYFLNDKADFLYKTKSAEIESDSILKTFKTAENIAFESKNTSVLTIVYPKIAAMYEQKKDLENQIDYLDRSNKLKDSLGIAQTKMLNKINLIIEPEKTDNTKYYLWIFLLLILFIGFCVFFFRSRKVVKPTLVYNESITEGELLRMALEDHHSFYINFLKKFPDFNAKLLAINPTMKNSDIEFAALIKIGMDDQQIAQVKKISMKAVSSKKYRIRKKLHLSAEENTSDWLKNF